MGELSAALEKMNKHESQLPTARQLTKTDALAEAGISHAVANRAEQLASASEEIKKALADGVMSITQAFRHVSSAGLI